MSEPYFNSIKGIILSMYSFKKLTKSLLSLIFKFNKSIII